MNKKPKHDDFYLGLGWMYAEACNLFTKGVDIRKIPVEDLIRPAVEDFENNRDEDIESCSKPPHEMRREAINEMIQKGEEYLIFYDLHRSNECVSNLPIVKGRILNYDANGKLEILTDTNSIMVLSMNCVMFLNKVRRRKK